MTENYHIANKLLSQIIVVATQANKLIVVLNEMEVFNSFLRVQAYDKSLSNISSQ